MKSFAMAFQLGAALLCCASPILADEASKKAKIDEILQLTHTDQMLRQTMEQVKSMQMEQLKKMEMPAEERTRVEEVQRKTMALLAERLSYEKVKPMYIQLYAEVFGEEEIDGIVSFYKSPAGKAMIEKMPLMMQRLMPAMQKLTTDVQAEVQKILEDARQKQK